MSAIGNRQDLPDFTGIKPLLAERDLAAMDQAIADFGVKQAAFHKAAGNAETAVAVLLAWVGVGDKLVTLAGTLAQRRLSEQDLPTAKRGKLTAVQTRLADLAGLRASLERDLGALIG